MTIKGEWNLSQFELSALTTWKATKIVEMTSGESTPTQKRVLVFLNSN